MNLPEPITLSICRLVILVLFYLNLKYQKINHFFSISYKLISRLRPPLIANHDHTRGYFPSPIEPTGS